MRFMFTLGDKLHLIHDIYRKLKEDKIGDYVLAFICPRHFPKISVKKLHDHSSSPFLWIKVLRVFNFICEQN